MWCAELRPRRALLPAAVALALGQLLAGPAVLAQSVGTPSVYRQTIGPADYAANSRVARILLELDRNGVPADGQTPVRVVLRLLGADGTPLSGTVLSPSRPAAVGCSCPARGPTSWGQVGWTWTA